MPNQPLMRLFTRDQRIDALRKIPSFERMSRRELEALSRLVTEVDVPPGKVLARRGDPGHEFMIILDGTARVDVSRNRVVRLGPGDFFGEMSLLDGEPRSATVTAETRMRLLVIAHREFWSLLYEVPSISRKIVVTLSQRVRRAQEPVT